MLGKKVSKNEQTQILKLYKDGVSVRKIGNMLELTHKTVSKYLKNNGIEIKQRNGGIVPINPRKLFWATIEDRDKMICNMYKDGKSSIYIHRAIGVSKRTVLKVLKQNSIKIRPQKPIEINANEIKKLKSEGLSLAEISAIIGVSDLTMTKKLKDTDIKFVPGDTMRSFAGRESEVIKMYRAGYSTYDIAEICGITNPDSIAKYLKQHNVLRSREEVRELVAIKLSNREAFKSRPHKKLESILHRASIQYSSEFPLDGWNFDIHLNDTNILIDVNGDYWHRLPNRISRDIRKKSIANKNGYKLVWVWEHQLNREEFVRNYVDYLVNNESAEFGFDEIELCVGRDVTDIVKLHHYSGKCPPSKLSIAAMLNGKVIAGLTFSSVVRLETAYKQKLKHNEVLELSRLAIDHKYHKYNFASWLISKSIKMVKNKFSSVRLLVSFADSTYNHSGTIYKASNWILDGKVKEDYWYVSPSRSIIHKRTIWGRAKKGGVTESVYAAKHKLQKVWGHHKHRYIYKLR